MSDTSTAFFHWMRIMFKDRSEGFTLAEMAKAWAAGSASVALSATAAIKVDEHFMSNIDSIMRDLDTVLMGDIPEDLGGISLLLEHLRATESRVTK